MSDYVSRQNAYLKQMGIKKGVMVKIFGKAEDHEDGWQNGWNSDGMKIGKIVTVDSWSESGVHMSDGYGYPYWVIKKVSEPLFDEVRLNTNTVIRIPKKAGKSVTVLYKSEEITFPMSVMKKLANAINKMTK